MPFAYPAMTTFNDRKAIIAEAKMQAFSTWTSFEEGQSNYPPLLLTP
jgi:hypothetical protein